MNIIDYLLYSFVGMAVVFFALILLMLMISVMTRLVPTTHQAKKNSDIKLTTDKNVHNQPTTVNIYDTDPRDAAMIMAIVADNIDIPVEQLRFISIKEIKQ